MTDMSSIMGGIMREANQSYDQEPSSTQDQNKSPWWHKKWVAMITLFIFYPLGLFFAWKNPAFSRKYKVLLTIVFGFVFLIMLATKDDKKNNKVDSTNYSQSDSTSHQKKEPYEAIISCLFAGKPFTFEACFVGSRYVKGSHIELEIDGRNRIYQFTQFNELGVKEPDGLHIMLPKHFKLQAENVGEYFILSVIIKNEKGDVVFEDQASQYGVIRVRN
jgi:hypothetical protein